MAAQIMVGKYAIRFNKLVKTFKRIRFTGVDKRGLKRFKCLHIAIHLFSARHTLEVFVICRALSYKIILLLLDFLRQRINIKRVFKPFSNNDVTILGSEIKAISRLFIIETLSEQITFL